MRSWKILVLAFILVLGVPVFVLAGGPFYASTDGSETGDGLTLKTARKAANLTELQAAFTEFASELDGDDTAIVYWWNANTNQYCRWTLSSDGTAVPGWCLYGKPPDTGVGLTPPLVAASLLVLAAALFGGGWFLLRRQQRATRA